jgi:diguanylate cyclase (GGDEF)-like protein
VSIPSHDFFSIEQKKIAILSSVAWYCLYLHVGLLLFFAYIDAYWLSGLNVLSVICWAISLNCFSKGLLACALQLICLEVLVHSVAVCLTFGIGLGFHYYLWAIACILLVEQSIPLFRSVSFAITMMLVFGILVTVDFPNLSDFPYPHLLPYIHFSNVMISGLPMIYALASLREMSIQSREELSNMASKDALTGLHNRRFAQKHLSCPNWFSSHDREQVFVVMADIDHFKSINDRFGHERGDDVLRIVSGIFNDCFEQPNLAIRWGGEEFLFVVHEEDTHTIQRFIDLITTLLEQHNISREQLKVTLSFGVAKWHKDTNFELAVSQADQALYESKRSGRDRVTYFN